MNPEKSFDLEIGSSAVSERSFMSQVYLWMAMALALTGIVAWGVAQTPSLVTALMQNFFLFIMIMLAQLGLVFWLSSSIFRIGVTTATIGFSIYATLNGIIFSTIFLAYTAASIASTFFVTAGTFAIVSVYGFATKQDLTSVGSFSLMALIGLILASFINMFFKNPVFDYILSYIGVAIFIGLTAYDTQQLKKIHEQGAGSGEMLQKVSLMGALRLYLDFINLFLLLLRIMGRRRD